ncbi:Zinc finger C2H2-type,Zinc finger, RING/FYVE/PHD-type [Cinara cedri]|uniref:Zinc finger C2H2-type,Zinc finger, RING/FYVE/PHD-type n=1 Tax=Cinara cedri TaxID=506608 RepID=A0A5E4MHB3_9HEMI|nr:Zinc finger C2H2-type,Zinc finger, RING/FYVE/PHD-type [Cinara cedri]
MMIEQFGDSSLAIKKFPKTHNLEEFKTRIADAVNAVTQDYETISESPRVYCPNNCGHSYRGNNRKNHLNRHIQYECGIDPQFQYYEKMKNTYQIYCPNNCGRSYKGHYKKYNLKRHLLFECGVVPKFQCHIYYDSIAHIHYMYCSNAITSRTFLKDIYCWNLELNHNSNAILVEKQFIHESNYNMVANIHYIFCPNGCGRSYAGCMKKSNLKRHLMLECGVEPMFQCYVCQKRFTRKSNLKRHSSMHNKHLKVIKCHTSNLNTYLQYNYIIVTYIYCIVSNYFIKYYHSFEYNTMSIIQRIFCPNSCGRSYSGNHRSTNLKRHLRYECGIEPQFTCYTYTIAENIWIICPNNFGFINKGIKGRWVLIDIEDNKLAEKRLYCPNYCGRSYRAIGHLNRHLRFECGVESKFRCHVCQKRFAQKNLKRHLTCVYDIKKTENIQRIHCPNNCGRSYKGYYGKYNLNKHLMFQCGVEPQFQCPYCQKRYNGTEADIQRIYCPNHCGRSYRGHYRKYNLNRHLTFGCGVEPKFQCHVCQKRFTRKSSLKCHYHDTEAFIQRIYCPNNCGRNYQSNNGLKRHLRYECGVEPQFRCPICPKRFSRKSNLKQHVLFYAILRKNSPFLRSFGYEKVPVIDRVYCPNRCGRSYTGDYRKSSLKRHLRDECGVEPQFCCTICQKRFTQKSNGYTMSHIDSIQCPNNCGRSYKGARRKYTLNRHLMFECGVDPQFQCQICQRKFPHNSNLKKHLLCVHQSFIQ